MRKRVVKEPSGEPQVAPCPACGLKQSRGAAAGGKCIRCGEDMAAKAPAVKEALDPSGSFQKPSQGPPEAPARPQENLSMLAHALGAQGYVITLPDLAQMEPHVRESLARYVAGQTDKPPVLVNADREMARARSATGADDPKAPGKRPQPLDPIELVPSHVTNLLNTAPETVRYEWGEEALQLAQFCTVRIGPFASTTGLREGETREEALARLRDDVVRFAEQERKRKVASFLVALRESRAHD